MSPEVYSKADGQLQEQKTTVMTREETKDGKIN